MKIAENENKKNEQLFITIERDRDKENLRYILEAAKEKAKKEIEDATMGEWKERAEILNRISRIEEELGY